MAITNHITNAVEKIKTSDNVQRDLNSTYLNGRESTYFVNVSEAQDVTGVKTFTNGVKAASVKSADETSSVTLTNGKIDIDANAITLGGTSSSGNSIKVGVVEFNNNGNYVTFPSSQVEFRGRTDLTYGFVANVDNSDTSITNKKYVDDCISTEALHIYVDNEGYVCVDYDKLPVRA